MNRFLTQRGQSFGLGGNTTPNRLLKLYELCCKLSEEQDLGNHTYDDIWNEIREWLLAHSRNDVSEAVMHQGASRNETVIHLVCEHRVPYDIIGRMLAAAPIAAQLIDINGRLPLHYAAANGSDDKVLEILVDVYPNATQMADSKGVVPLHFALSTKGSDITPFCARVLSQGHANSCKEEVGGMLPLHYACAYGAPVEVLEILVHAYDKDLHEAKDKRGMVPLHYICGNPYRPTSPEALAYIISVSPRSIDVMDRNSSIPLRLLAIKTASSKHETEPYYENAQKILELYLHAEPIYNSDFLTALQALPDWLRDRAVTTKSVQIKLNQIIATRLPSAFLIGDFFCYISIIISFSLGVTCTIEDRMPTESMCDSSTYSTVLLFSTFYFLLREIVQILSLLSLGLIRTYFSSATNYLDVIILFIGFYFFFDISSLSGFGADCKGGSNCITDQLNTFRTTASVALLLVWAALLSFLKSTYLEFAVFIGGLSNVFSKFLPFLVSLFIILFAFADIFVMIYFDSERCKCGLSEPPDYCDIKYPDFEDIDHFCTPGKTLLKVYTMLLGEVSDEEFLVQDVEKEGYVQNLGIVFFIFFMFLVVILLANVLIAIVTDSYGVIKNERASVVFWTNRLDYIAECDAIINGPWKNRLREIFYTKDNKKVETKVHEENDAMKRNSRENFGGDLWDKCMNPSNSFSDYKFYTVEFWTIFIIRFLSFILILVWLPLGLVTLGLLWPPQVREGIFYSTVNKSAGGQMKLLEQRSNEVRSLRDELKDLQDEILKEMSSDRDEVIGMKTQFREMKETLQTEMKTIKQIVTLLFDLQSLDDE